MNEKHLTPRLFIPPHGNFFLFGPRGTGKSTWIHTAVPDALVIDLLHADNYRTYLTHPEHLREVVAGHKGTLLIVIDEVQKVPALLDEVHALIESDKKVRFILSGSSTCKLKRAGVNLLAGRLSTAYMHPFIAAETGTHFSLSRALKYGMIPLVHASEDETETLNSYTHLYLTEEVKAEGLIRKAGDFARFLEALSFSHSSVLNISNVAGECNVERKTVERYITILEGLLLAARLPVFTRRAKRKTVAHPKFYYFDAGVYRILRPTGPLDHPAEIDGAALEGLVFQHLRAWADYSKKAYSLSYWRTHTGKEVDFIVYGRDAFYAIEVKNTQKLRSQDFKGLHAFHTEYPEATCLLLYRGNEQFCRDGVYCIPCEKFLLDLTPDTPVF